jgi:hypothetical protein
MSITITGGVSLGGGVGITAAPPGGPTAGWFGGGYASGPAPTSTVQRITFATDTSTASVRGPLSLARRGLAATGNTIYGWFGGGNNPAAGNGQSTVDRITYSTDTATASVRGPLSSNRYSMAATGNTTDGWFGGGYQYPNPAPPGYRSTVDRITYATDTATASVRGPLAVTASQLAATGTDTNGWFGGGYATGLKSTVQRITFATDTNTASSRGPLSIGVYSVAATTDSTTYGWFGGGEAPARVSTVQRITYATDTDVATVRGPLSAAIDFSSGVGDTEYGWFGGGQSPGGRVSTVQRITYATDTATASIRGALTGVVYRGAGSSGLQ